MKHSTRFVLFMAILCSASLAACSSSSDMQDSQPPTPTSADVPTDKPQQTDRLLPGVDVPEIELLTPTEGVGLKPKFEWEVVDGAASYALVLFDADKRTYWAWMGNTPYVYLGSSLTPPPEDSAGPILQSDMRWAVVAYDTEHHLLATSSFRPISP